MKYLSQLWHKVLVEDATLLESTRGFQVMKTKCKEVTLGDKEK